jgi:hypothetical protein
MACIMADEKVVIKQAVLKGSPDPNFLQRVALVYIKGEEYRVSAPPEGTGSALDWINHWSVRQLTEVNSETIIEGALRVLAIKLVQEELERQKSDEPGKTGMHPDGEHCAAQICTSGHVHHCDGETFKAKEFCKECGASCIDACTYCKVPIRGTVIYRPATTYHRPLFCHACGRPYPWLEDRLRTARELLDHDDKLTEDDRQALWPDLQFVMSNPKADITPAKTKLVTIELGKAAEWVKDAVIDLMAKTAAEVIKG